jgi:hypothetical protein
MSERIAHHTGLYLPSVGTEARFEAQVAYVSATLFPDYYWCDFKAEIRSPDGLVHPDAALIARDYSRWFVVEVELVKHSWEDHILPQLTKLAGGYYNSGHRDRLVAANTWLDADRMDSIDIYNPEIVLIIDSAPSHIRAWCRANHVICLEASPYLSHTNDLLIAVTGDHLPAFRSNVGAPPIAIARRSRHGSDVVLLDFTFRSRFTELREPFTVRVGSEMVSGRNLGVQPGSIMLSIAWSAFHSAVGLHEEYVFFEVGDRLYEVNSRNA